MEKNLINKGFYAVAGLDEVGRGPLAGPLVSAAVVLGRNIREGLADSKKITCSQRVYFANIIKSNALDYAVGTSSAEEIDYYGINQATIIAMKRAVFSLKIKPDFLLLDAFLVDLELPQLNLVKGEDKSPSIAAASIIAKVARDAIMEEYDFLYPQYGFRSHKGYPTKQHIQSLQQHGPCTIHRLSFRKVLF